jgi:hypothetical protein
MGCGGDCILRTHVSEERHGAPGVVARGYLGAMEEGGEEAVAGEVRAGEGAELAVAE